MAIAIQKPAPDFEAEAVQGLEFTNVKLSALRGKYVVLFFYPLDFTFVCPTGKEKSGERREEEIESEGERRERKRRASERGSLERNRAQPFPPPPPSKRKKKKTDLSKT